MEITISDQEITFDEVVAADDHPANVGMPATASALRDSDGMASVAAIHQRLTARQVSAARPAPTVTPAVPESVTAALAGWVQQFADEASTGLRDGLAQANGDLASLLQMNERLEADRKDLRAQLAQVTEDRDQAQTTLAECETQIGRLTVELQHARDVASNVLVGKAKDQLAIDGKDAQLAELRTQLERNVAASAALSDARLAAEMELVGAVTARDNLAAELKELRTQLEACHAERRTG